MSVQYYQSQVDRLRREAESLQREVERESRNEATLAQRLASAQRSLSTTSIPSLVKSKRQEAERLSQDLLKVQEKRANLQSRVAQKHAELLHSEGELSREWASERRKAEDTERRQRVERERREKALATELAATRSILASRTLRDTEARVNASGSGKEYDVFISYANEDREEFAKPLAEALSALGLSVWYADFILRVGDSLRRSIDQGLTHSRFGIVVLSGNFFAKNWPQYELDGLTAREMQGNKVILPIWHKVTKDEVLAYSPTLADKVALNSSLQSIQEIAHEIAGVVKGNT